MIHQSRKQHQGRKCNIKLGNVIKVENTTSMCITQCKEKQKDKVQLLLNLTQGN